MAETEKEIIKDIKENKIGKYQEKDLFELIKKANPEFNDLSMDFE